MTTPAGSSGDDSAAVPPPARKPRQGGVVIPNAPQWHQRWLAFIIWLAVRIIVLTMRFRFRDPHGYHQRNAFGPAIYSIWHNRIVLCLEMYARVVQAKFPAPGLAGLVSASKDGALLTAIFERFGLQPVRGSSSRRGAQAIRELNTWAERGYDLAITPDGPRGPRYRVADGAIALAQLTGRPIVPAAFHLNWKLTVKSWDRLQIPLPFARCEFVMGEILHVPRVLTDAEREQWRVRLEQAMLAITQD